MIMITPPHVHDEWSIGPLVHWSTCEYHQLPYLLQVNGPVKPVGQAAIKFMYTDWMNPSSTNSNMVIIVLLFLIIITIIFIIITSPHDKYGWHWTKWLVTVPSLATIIIMITIMTIAIIKHAIIILIIRWPWTAWSATTPSPAPSSTLLTTMLELRRLTSRVTMMILNMSMVKIFTSRSP